MALTIGLKPNSAFYINDTRVTVEQVFTSMNFKIKVHGKAMDSLFNITDRRSVEIMPKVMCSAGNKGSTDIVKIVIDAPRNMKILREKLYKQAQAEA